MGVEQLAFTAQFGDCRPHPNTVKGLSRTKLDAEQQVASFPKNRTSRKTSSPEQNHLRDYLRQRAHAMKRGVGLVQEAGFSPSDPRIHPINPNAVNETWHSDISCEVVPPACSVLQAKVIPGRGKGNTMFASMYLAYDSLSYGMKAWLESMSAVHKEQRMAHDED